jgi:predicted Zn-dependent protease
MYFKLPLLAGGSNRKAVEELEKALELSPNYTANYSALAEAYIAVGAEDKAVAVLKRFGEVQEPSDPAVYEEHRKDVSKLLSQFPAAGRTR